MSEPSPPGAPTGAIAPLDLAVIGGGVVGCAVLRAATLAGLKCVLLERGADILSGASKGNSGLLHTAFDAPVGSLEHRLMQRGRAIYLDIRGRMNLPLLETDALLVAWSDTEAQKLPEIAAKAHKNGVTSVRPASTAELRTHHPFLAESAVAGLVVPGEHVIDPWSAPLAYVLQALAHGARVLRQAEVTAAERRNGLWHLTTAQGPITARIVVAAAGNFGDRVEALAGRGGFAIRPRKGQFVVLDKTARRLMPTIVLPVPTERTKGIVLCPTIYGNVLVGPTAEDQDDRSQATVEEATLRHLLAEGARMVPDLAAEPVTAVYAGLRPASDRSDYIIDASPADGWITVAGIRSTGLTASLGIAEHIVGLVGDHFQMLSPVPDVIWPRVPNLAEHLPRDHQRAGRGDLVCLCETVTRAEIEAALTGPLPVGDLGGLKRRTRALMGRCQGFNCLAHVARLVEGRLVVTPPVERLGDGH
ncbi:MAG: NAD(P)/FAD-dependent oxidoreductase [Hyphomicrobiaceae bacterium]